MSVQTLKIALIGCGQIADAHLQEINKIGCAKVVAVCDNHLDLAKQAAARFGVPLTFDDVGRMLDQTKPDVVHITTPPHTHLPLSLQAIEAGAHVYVEKPFTVNVTEADQLLAAADRAGRKICVGHDQLFDRVWEECRAIHKRGELGDVVHVESVQGYSLSGPFGEVLSSEPNHWVHRLPGGLFQNVISHPLYKITDFLLDPHPRVWATWFGQSERYPFPTELRVMLQGQQATGSLTFSSSARPAQRLTRIYGTRKTMEADFESATVRRITASSLPGAFGKIEMPARQLRQNASALIENAWRFLRADLQYFGGMNRLFTKFYSAILQRSAMPIEPGEIRRVTAMMDDIFCCCRETQSTTGCLEVGNPVAISTALTTRVA